MTSIYFLIDAPSRRAQEQGTKLDQTEMSILGGLLSQAGIDRADCIFDSVLPTPVPGGKLANFYTQNKTEGLPGAPAVGPRKFFPADNAIDLARLNKRIADANPKLLVPLGELAFWSLCRRTGIKRFRGSPLLTHDGERKVLPTWPITSIFQQWNLRPIAFMDLCKAHDESKTRLLIRPRRIIHMEPSLNDIEEFYQKYIVPAPVLSTDIETKGGTITEIGFAPSIDRCLVVPFWSRLAADGNYWRTAEEEREAWRWVDRICREKKHIGQNYQYDMQYLSRTVGIPSPGFAGDTMLLHHTLQPELEKGLGFLGSIYTSEPSWKFMRADHSTLKREDD